MPASQENRQIAVTCPLGKDALLFHRMNGREKLGHLFEYQLELLSEHSDIHIKDVLGKKMSVQLKLNNDKERYFNGIVTNFYMVGQHGRFSAYKAIVRPWVWLLSRSSNCRIFQDMTVRQIIKEICNGPAYDALCDIDDSCLSNNYEVLPYCVQYRETDLNFLSRLMEQEGIYYFFKHTNDRHTMVLADSYAAHQLVDGYKKIEYKGQPDVLNEGIGSIYDWCSGGQIQPSAYLLNDFDFENAASSTSGGLKVNATLEAGFGQAAYTMYDYPGAYKNSTQGKRYARAKIESYHGQSERIEASTTARGLYPGALFALAAHPREEQNRDYLITEAQYELCENEYESSDGEKQVPFICKFSAVGKEYNYRPEMVYEKPVVQGPQTAIVVGPAGEEIYTDQYGRIKVKFHWDRADISEEKRSCWLRVAQSWAGSRWGTVFIPRIGQEVVVSFLEGDPDRPLVTGSVYNSDNMPPYELPAHATRTVIKSNSSKGGQGYNEIRLEDKKGEEEFFVQAQKDSVRIVKNNDSLTVGFETKDPGNQSIKIKNNQNCEIGNDQIAEIKNNQNITIGKNHIVEVKGSQEINVTGSCVITSKTSIELKVGSSSILIGPAEITIKSGLVKIN